VLNGGGQKSAVMTIDAPAMTLHAAQNRRFMIIERADD
jgi:hypothetical protein